MDMVDLEAKLKEATDKGARVKLVATDGKCGQVWGTQLEAGKELGAAPQ